MSAADYNEWGDEEMLPPAIMGDVWIDRRVRRYERKLESFEESLKTLLTEAVAICRRAGPVWPRAEAPARRGDQVQGRRKRYERVLLGTAEDREVLVSELYDLWERTSPTFKIEHKMHDLYKIR